MASRFVSGGNIDAQTGEHVSSEAAAAAATTSTTGTTGAGNDNSLSAAAVPTTTKAKWPTPAGGVPTTNAVGASRTTTGAAASTSSTSATLAGSAPAKTTVEWEAVERELEAERKRREEARRSAVEGEEKTLYDVLQANKAAKQAAFEEKAKLTNQFRSLDDDEIDFLDDVRERERAAEEKVRLETSEGLRAFREAQQLKGDGDELGPGGRREELEKKEEEERSKAVHDADEWAGEWKGVGGRKRRRHGEKEKEFRGIVRRKVGEGTVAAAKAKVKGEDEDRGANTGRDGQENQHGSSKGMGTKTTGEKSTGASASLPAAKSGLGLAAYDSDDSDE